MQGSIYKGSGNAFRWQFSRQTIVGVLLGVALFAFELFNFDTTRYALDNLLGGVTFAGASWATILAIAFCAIDFAGLAHLFTPQQGWAEPKEVWFLSAAWLLGASMNAVMTWWAVSLTVLSHPIIGNEIFNRGQLLKIVPIFVAVLVWLTRLLFIGGISFAGEHLFRSQKMPAKRMPAKRAPAKNRRSTAKPKVSARRPAPRTATNRRRTSYANNNRRPAAPIPMAAQPYRE